MALSPAAVMQRQLIGLESECYRTNQMRLYNDPTKWPPTGETLREGVPRTAAAAGSD